MKDIIIIGSGTSGGVLAYYLTKAGAKCLLLEAGKAFSAKTFPNNEMDYSAQLFWNGGMEFNTDVTWHFCAASAWAAAPSSISVFWIALMTSRGICGVAPRT
jgi:choline dehydrogenase-like flavoprotein